MEGIVMSYTVNDYVKEYTKAHLQYLAPEEVLSRFSPDQRLQGLSPDDIEAYLLKLKNQPSH
jgi:hypothetical protein